jgi:hypothetical protein
MDTPPENSRQYGAGRLERAVFLYALILLRFGANVKRIHKKSAISAGAEMADNVSNH